MIEKIILHNFQCHKDVTLELGRSTVLLGDSNSGKTAVLRALYWVLYNIPSGDSYVSYWAQKKTKNGFAFKKDEYTSVTVLIDGHEIVRKRMTGFNGYIVDGEIFEALGTAVPEKVTEIFNLADASVQKQMDAPFLLSFTPGKASQYLSDLVGLGCVDDILSIAKKKASDTSAKIDSTEEDIAGLQKELDTYGWVGESEKLLDKATAVEPEIARITKELESLTRTINDYKAIRDYPAIPSWLDRKDDTPRINELTDAIGMLNRYIGACRTLRDINPVLERIAALGEPRTSEYSDRHVYALATTIRNYTESRRVLRLNTNILGLISKLPVPREPKWDSRQVSMIGRSIEDYGRAVTTISDCADYLDDAYGSLDGMVCPTCGRPMDRNTCLH